MNGDTPQPPLGFEESIEAAQNLAAVIYNLSEQCLMAHTIRAVEWYVTREYQKPRYSIVLQVEAGVNKRWGAKSWALLRPESAVILIDEDLSRDQKRVCVAHECYHVLEQFRLRKSDQHRIEDICDQFANDLCKKHDKFYRDDAKIALCRFGSLPINSKRHD
jgi:hypothetical protein